MYDSIINFICSNFLYCAELFIIAISKVTLYFQHLLSSRQFIHSDNTKHHFPPLDPTTSRISWQSFISFQGHTAIKMQLQLPCSFCSSDQEDAVDSCVYFVHETLASFGMHVSQREVYHLLRELIAYFKLLGQSFLYCFWKTNKVCSSKNPQTQMQTYSYCLIQMQENDILRKANCRQDSQF